MTHADYLLTGASGYFGKIIFEMLSSSYSVLGLSRASRGTYPVDLAHEVPRFRETFQAVIHSAGKAHVIPQTEKEAAEFFRVNHTGTYNLITGLENLAALPKYFVFISTVAVYGKDSGELINETMPLLGSTPYAKSKIMAEEFLTDWCAKHNVILTILRLPLIVGNNPPGNLGTMVRMMKRGLYFAIGSGAARKSMVLAEDVARFIPVVQSIGGVYNLTDGYHPSMFELENALAKKLRKKRPVRLPDGVLHVIAKAGDLLGEKAPLTSLKFSKLTSSLTFSDSKAREIGWNPHPVITNLPF